MSSSYGYQSTDSAPCSAFGVPSTDMISNHSSSSGTSSSITNPIITNPESTVNYQFNPGATAPADMETLLRQQLRQNVAPYIQRGFRQSMADTNQPSSVSKPLESPLGILNAEQYDVLGASIRTARRESLRQQQEQQSPPSVYGIVVQKDKMAQGHTQPKTPARGQKLSDVDHAVGDKRRKRQKLSSEDEGDDDAAKKSRGRPRLDTKDETAADRRRTQIRMAQRAYRHRKETTISSLEKQVNELRAANEQMSNIFIGLHDFAVGRGLIHREPEFGNHLKSTTERFLALAKSVATDEPAKDDEGTSVEGSKQGLSEPDVQQIEQPQLQLQPQPPQSFSAENPSSLGTSVWGYQILEGSNNEIQTGQSEWKTEWEQQPYMATAAPVRPGHQIITHATPDNASFGFDLFDNFNNNFQQYRVEVPDVTNYSNVWNVQEALPLTKTLSHHETTFGRHLHRAAIERGWRLISSKTPHPARLLEVFGFCLRFETKQEIMERMRAGLDKTSKDPMYNWRHPFSHLGGAGTHYPLDERMDKAMPQFDGGMSTGPWPQAVLEAREKAMIDAFRIALPGFEGEFFDANDVEGYLKGRGIDIPPHVEFIDVNLDLIDLGDVSSPPSNSESNSYNPRTPSNLTGFPTALSGLQDNLVSQVDDFGAETLINNMNMSFFADWNQDETNKSNNPFGFSSTQLDMIPREKTTVDSSNRGRLGSGRIVSMSVTVLVEELISKALCLGRTPGFRPSDVELALRRTLQAAV